LIKLKFWYTTAVLEPASKTFTKVKHEARLKKELPL